MSDKLKVSFKVFAVVAAVSSSLFSINIAHANTVIQCGSAVCTSDFNVLFNGKSAGGGQLLYDAKTGNVSLNMASSSLRGNAMITNGMMTWSMGDGSKINLSSLTGNTDPIISFGIGASTKASGATFAMNFDLPIAIDGPIKARSSVSYSLTSNTTAGAQVAPISNIGNIVSAWEVDTSVGGRGSLNKGVDVGDRYFFTGGPQPQTKNSPVYTATNQFTGNLAYDLMSVHIGFSLSPNSAVGMSGFVNQTAVSAVPVPAAMWLFGSGLIGLLGVARRKKT